jgi:hypothetical protein
MSSPIRFENNLDISYGLGNRGIFLFPKRQESTCGPTNRVPGAICPDVMWPKGNAGHSVSPNQISKLRMHGNTPPLMHTPSWHW